VTFLASAYEISRSWGLMSEYQFPVMVSSWIGIDYYFGWGG
jgi:hypothetical protein